MTFQPDVSPLGSLTASALVALLPLLTMFVTLGLLRWKAHFAGLASLVVAIGVAIFAFHMPAHLALLTATEGAAFGIFPITYIVLSAVWLYEITVVSGRFEDLRATFRLVSDDPRILAILIAFCFGGLLEALAGFGAPVAITGVMLVAIGYRPMRAAATVLLANTAPVAFGAVAIPIITAGNLTGIDYHEIGGYVAVQTASLAWFMPLILLLVADGVRGLKEVWPAALVVGITFALGKLASANFISVELTDVIASLVSLAACVAFLRVWKPRGTAAAQERLQAESGAASPAPQTLDGKRIAMALFPYILVVIVFSLAKLVTPISKALAATDLNIPWPGLHGHLLTASGTPATSTMYTFAWLSSPGTILLLTGLIVAVVYGVSMRQAGRTFLDVLYRLRFTFLTIGSVLALAYVMNFSGQTLSIGTWIAGTGAAFAFLSPVLGWIGTAVTGSDTSANALFATLQQTAATHAGIDPTLLVAGNTSGGVVGKLISPQNLAIAATAVGLVGQESDILRKVVGWSFGLLVILCLLVGLQSTSVLSWMLP